MYAPEKTRTAAEVLVDQLIRNGVKHVFCVPGESYLGVLDAFHDRDITVTVCRQEGGAAMMAEAVGKATGRAGRLLRDARDRARPTRCPAFTSPTRIRRR